LNVIFVYLTDLNQSRENSEVGSSNTGSGIPSRSTLVSTVSAASRDDVVSDGDIEESIRVGSSSLVNERIKEAERNTTVVESDIVQQSEDSSPSGGRSRGTTNSGNSSVQNDLEVDITESRTIGSGTVGIAVRARGGERDVVAGDISEIVGNSSGLKAGLGIINEKSTTRSESGDSSFRSRVSGQEFSSTDGSDVRAGSRVRRIESAVADFTSTKSAARSVITRCDDHRNTTGSDLLEFSIDS